MSLLEASEHTHNMQSPFGAVPFFLVDLSLALATGRGAKSIHADIELFSARPRMTAL